MVTPTELTLLTRIGAAPKRGLGWATRWVRRILELERRVTALEEQLARAPGEGCPKCGSLAFRLAKSEDYPGARRRTYRCQDWFEEPRIVHQAK